MTLTENTGYGAMIVTNKQLQWILYLHMQSRISHYKIRHIYDGYSLLVHAADVQQTSSSMKALIIKLYMIYQYNWNTEQFTIVGTQVALADSSWNIGSPWLWKEEVTLQAQPG